MSISSDVEFIEFCSDFSYYSNILFISNSVFRTGNMQKFAQPMMNISQTMCPLILGYFTNVSEGKKIQICNEYITGHGIADKSETWNYHRLREGMLSFADVEGHEDFKELLIQRLLLNYFGNHRNFTYTLFTYPFRFEEYSSEYWQWFYRKCSMNFTGYKKYILTLFSIIIRFYYNSKFLNKLIKARTISENIIHNGRN